MNFLYRNLTPRQLVGLGLIVPILALFVIGWLQWRSVSDMLTTRMIVRQNRTVQLALGIFRYSLSDAESCQFRYILTNNTANIDLYKKLAAQATDQLKQIRSLTADTALQQKYLDRIEPLFKEKIRFTDQSIAMEQSGDHPGAMKIITSDDTRANMLDIESALEDMQVVQTQVLLQGQNHYQHDFKLNALLSLTGIALSLGFIVGIILLLRRQAQVQSFVTLNALSDMTEYENGAISIEEYLKRRHQALATHGQAQIEAERILALLERRQNRPMVAQAS
jgi:CHASE3 domain sensor protein